MTDPELLLAATRYEKLRKMNPKEFALLWGDSFAFDMPFDELVDTLPEPFRTNLKEEPKTCQTCKHWGDNIERKTESLSTSWEKCKEIYKNIDILDEVEWKKREWVFTRATFGCNGYEQKKPTDGNL
jgi:hypothetical protein